MQKTVWFAVIDGKKYERGVYADNADEAYTKLMEKLPDGKKAAFRSGGKVVSEVKDVRMPADIMSLVEKNLEALAISADVEGHTGETAKFLAMIAQFHHYSFYNTLSILAHRPDATMVAGFVKWKSFGRVVIKGEHGIPILFPCVARKEKEVDGKKEEERAVFYKVGFVFDVAQTEGAPLPPSPSIIERGDAPEYIANALRACAAAHSIKIEVAEIGDHTYGIAHGGKITVDENAIGGGDQTLGWVRVVVHELAHELLGYPKVDAHVRFDRGTRETQADAVTHAVLTALGLRSNCPAYIAGVTRGMERNDIFARIKPVADVARDIMSYIFPKEENSEVLQA